MNPRTVNWLLGGALAASLTLHCLCWTDSRSDAGGCLAGNTSQQPSVALSTLALTPDQRELLLEQCSPCCAERDQIRREREETLDKLSLAVSKPRIDPMEIAGLARKLGELRERGVMADARAVEMVRSVLRPDQLRMLSQCCGDPSQER